MILQDKYIFIGKQKHNQIPKDEPTNDGNIRECVGLSSGVFCSACVPTTILRSRFSYSQGVLLVN